MKVKKASNISIEEARKIMGDEAGSMSEEDLQKLLECLNSLARAFVQAVQNDDIMYSKHSIEQGQILK